MNQSTSICWVFTGPGTKRIIEEVLDIVPASRKLVGSVTEERDEKNLQQSDLKPKKLDDTSLMLTKGEIKGNLSGYSNLTSIYEGRRLNDGQDLDRRSDALSCSHAGDSWAVWSQAGDPMLTRMESLYEWVGTQELGWCGPWIQTKAFISDRIYLTFIRYCYYLSRRHASILFLCYSPTFL